jgi:predicted ATPase/class 3 adenylate cyclase
MAASPHPDALQAAIVALEAQRQLLGDAVVDAALAALAAQRDAAAAVAGTTTTAAARSAPIPAAPATAPAAARPLQQLKQVSVLFVDVVGSTAIGQQLAPEDISAVMDGALARYTDIVQRHHGRVLQYAGDSLLAAFGTEAAREDDVESAVQAGLAIIDETQRLAPLLQARHGLPGFNVRAGIHTGQVLLGAGVDAEGSIRGAAVNLAARMEQSAPPGRLCISHDTFRHVSGLIDTTEQLVNAKGVDGPLRGHLVERMRPRALRVSSRGIGGLATPMVGRADELASLLAALSAVATQGRLQVVTVVGDAGLGKSRLVDEFQRALAAGNVPCWLLVARAQPRSALHPFSLLRDLLAWQLQISDSDAAADARAKLVNGLRPLFADEGEAPIHVLGHLVGLDFSTSPHLADLLADDSALRDAGFAALQRLLRRLAASRGTPLVMLLDDLHWADAGSMDFLRHLFDGPRDLPLLALALTRPSLFDSAPRWAELAAPDRRLTLRPLDAEFGRQLADLLLQRLDEVPATLRRLIIDQADGNPFYMEELVKMLIDDGVIVAEAEHWRLRPERLGQVRVPQTLTGVLQARLDALAAPERLALQQAAIVGHVFSAQALAAIDPAAGSQLAALQRKQLLRRAAPASGEHDYSFGHHLLHQVTYDTVLRDARRHGHQRVGAWWRARAEVPGPQQVDPAACRALAEAHDHGCRADPQDFIAWFDRQFFNYYNAFAGRVLRPLSASVVDLAERHCGADDVATARALTNLARVALLQSETATAEPLLQRALAIQERALGDDHADTTRTIAALGACHQGRGDMAAAEPLLRRVFEIRSRVLGADDALTLGTLDVLAHVVTELGRLAEAEDLCRRALAARQRAATPDGPATAAAMTALGEVLVKRGQAPAAEALIRQALALQQQALPAAHPNIGLSQWHLAEALRAQARPADAQPLARQALANWEAAFGTDHEWTAWALISLAEVRLALGDGGDAAALADRALRIYQRLYGAGHAQVGVTLGVLARAQALRGGAP